MSRKREKAFVILYICWMIILAAIPFAFFIVNGLPESFETAEPSIAPIEEIQENLESQIPVDTPSSVEEPQTVPETVVIESETEPTFPQVEITIEEVPVPEEPETIPVLVVTDLEMEAPIAEEPLAETTEEEIIPLPAVEEVAVVKAIPPAPSVISFSSSLEPPKVPAAPALASAREIEEVLDIPEPEPIEEMPEEPVSPRVPSAPSLFVSNSFIEEEEEYRYTSWDDDDFWSDFFVVGEDELALLDGSYYMGLAINGIEYGDIEVVIEGDKRYINAIELEGMLEGNLKDEAKSRIFEGGPDYLSEEELNDRGVGTEIDTSAFRVKMTISPADMPWQTLSLATTSGRTYSKPMAGALKPHDTNFSIVSKLADSISFVNSDTGLRLTNTLSVNSTAVFFKKLNLDFNFSLRSVSNHTDFNFGSFRFYMIFPEKMTKVSLGNVGTSLISPAGRPLGISIEKNFSYSQNGAKKKNVHASTLVLEKESLVEVENNGKIFYSKVLSPGNYNLQDFSLITGVNKILIRVKPLDGSEVEEYSYSFAYSSSLLSPGEFYYSAAVATGYEMEDNLFRYENGNLALSGSMQYGLNKSTTVSFSAAAANKNFQESLVPQVRMSAEVDHANHLGVARYNLNLNYMNLNEGITTPEVFARVGEQISFKNDLLSYLTASVSYQSPKNILSSDERHHLQLSLGLGGSLPFVNWSIGGTINAYTDTIEDSHYSSYLTLGANPFDNFSISLSLNATGNIAGSSSLTGKILGSYSFGGSSATASIEEGSSRISLSTTMGKTSLGGSISAPGYSGFDSDFFDRIRYNANLNMSQDFGLFALSGSFNTPLEGQNYSGSVTASTSVAYASGAIGVGTDINQNFLVVKQSGSLKNNDVFAGYVGSTEFKKLPQLFGKSMYYGFSQVTDTHFVLYSEPKKNHGMKAWFPVVISADSNGASVITLETEDIYSVSGIARNNDGHVFANDSSPLYAVTSSEGILTLKETEDYIFTDENGRFIFDDLQAGSYGFDAVDADGKWTLFLFDIEEGTYIPGFINLVENRGEESSLILPEEYDCLVELAFDEALTTDGYWDMLYPNLGADV